MRLLALLLFNGLLGTVAIANGATVSPAASINGIGVVIIENNGLPLITEVLPYTPAISSGLEVHDKILQVNGREVFELPLSQVAGLIRGPAHSVVKLTIFRPGQFYPITFAVKRGPIRNSY